MNYGEPAFPVRDYSGMTLRDYFAAAALQIGVEQWSNLNPHLVADVCYRVADAMLEERSKE